MSDADIERLEAWFLAKYGYPLGSGPQRRIHPEQWEAEQREMERAERDREFRRVYGDGR